MVNVIGTVNIEKAERKNWEFFLHKVEGMTFDDWKKRHVVDRKSEKVSKDRIVEGIKSSFSIAKDFKPS